MMCLDCNYLSEKLERAHAVRDAAFEEQAALKAELAAVQEQLHRSATVCPKDGCMLWRGHTEEHATREFLTVVIDRAKKLEVVANAARDLRTAHAENYTHARAMELRSALWRALSALDTPGAKEG